MGKSYALSNLYKGFNLTDAFLRSYIYPHLLLHFPMSLGYFRCYPTKKRDLSYDVYFFFEIVFDEFWLINSVRYLKIDLPSKMFSVGWNRKTSAGEL